MLSIHQINSNSLAQWYGKELSPWVTSRLQRRRINIRDKKKLELDILEILTAEPPKLLKLSNEYNLLFKKQTIGRKKPKLVTNRHILAIFNYKAFRQKFGFSLAEKLHIPCCPYCNRGYTTTHETVKENGVDIKKVFPEFDHFYPQSKYPLLALSFYNLIPSCNYCNTHFKGSKDPISHNLFHPYTKLTSTPFRFKFYPENYMGLIGKQKKIKLNVEYLSDNNINNQIKSSLKFFNIKETYEDCHSELIKDLIDKRISYSNEYLRLLQTTFNLNFNLSYRILTEVYYEESKLYMRPFSKLKRDIHEDLEITRHI